MPFTILDIIGVAFSFFFFVIMLVHFAVRQRGVLHCFSSLFWSWRPVVSLSFFFQLLLFFPDFVFFCACYDRGIPLFGENTFSE